MIIKRVLDREDGRIYLFPLQIHIKLAKDEKPENLGTLLRKELGHSRIDYAIGVAIDPRNWGRLSKDVAEVIELLIEDILIGRGGKIIIPESKERLHKMNLAFATRDIVKGNILLILEKDLATEAWARYIINSISRGKRELNFSALLTFEVG